MSTRSSLFYVGKGAGLSWNLHVYRDYRSEKDKRWDAIWIEVGPYHYNPRLRLWPLPPIIERR